MWSVESVPDPSLERRVDRLEEAMADLARASAENKRDWLRHRAEMRRLSAESERAWRQFRAESDRAQQERRAESDRAQQEHRAESDRAWQERQSELDRARQERQAELDRAQQERRAELDREWREFRDEMRRESGELSRRLGTMAEDLVAPSVGRVLRTVIGASEDEVTAVAVRVRRRTRRRPGEMVEFDVVAVCGDYALVNETKSRLTPPDIPAFVERLATVRDFFPELADKRILGAIASLYVGESLVRLGERQGLIVLGFGEDLMDVLNSPGFVPREF